MQLYFEVEGLIVSLEVILDKLPDRQRNLIKSRLDGNDVRKYNATTEGTPVASTKRLHGSVLPSALAEMETWRYIKAKAPTFAALMDAIEEDERQSRAKLDPDESDEAQ